MSMFYELMMRKKEQIMYATIKGTLTENDGVFSGFSASNYLLTEQALKPTGAFEIKLKFKVTDRSITNGLFHSSQTLVTGSGRFGFALVTASNGKLNFFASANGTSWLFDENSANWLIQNNVDYYVKFGWTGTEYYVDLSSDDTTYNRVISYNSTTPVTQLINYSSIGTYRAVDNIYPLTGSIDLNKSYIKLGSTKYNLQAVVGYTVVGSPTITDGVVSGFSSSNYLKIAYNQNSGNITEFIIKIEDKNVTGTAIFFTTTSATNIRIIMNGTSIWYNFNNKSSTYFSMPNGNNYFVKYTYRNNIASLYLSEDGINYSLLGSSEVSDYGSSLIINLGANDNMGDTKINLKETYIKVNNKLWFNGQQA